jgi:hypothetical protein
MDRTSKIPILAEFPGLSGSLLWRKENNCSTLQKFTDQKKSPTNLNKTRTSIKHYKKLVKEEFVHETASKETIP